MMSDLKAFQEDLRNGMTINDALIKHNLDFKKTVEALKGHSDYPKKRLPNKYGTYIYFHQKRYRVIRKINGKTTSFGSYDTLEEAKQRRDELEKNGWKE
jgi:hypothetical protein